MDANNNNAGVVDNNNQQNQNTGADVQVPKTSDEMLKESNYQSEFDKKVQKSLDTARAKWEAEQEAKQSEADKLSKMKEDERKNYELDKARKEKEEAEAKLNAYELKEEAIKMANAPETNKRLKETTPKSVVNQNNGGSKKSIPNVF